MLNYFFSFLFCLASFLTQGQHYNFRNYSVNEGLAQSQVYALCEDQRHALWVGTRGGGVNRFDGFSFQQFTEEEGLANNFIRCLLEDKDGMLWLGTDHGLSRYDGKSFTSFFEKEGLKNSTVNDLCLDAQNRLWIATEKGVFVYHQNTFTSISQSLHVATEKVTSLYCDQHGAMWIGTQYGVVKLTFKEEHYTIARFGKSEGLSHEDVTDITGDGDGVWIGTYGGGVSHYNGHRFFNLTVADGLLRNSIYGLYYAGNKQIWLASSAGVTVIEYTALNKDSLRYTYYTEDNGLCNNVTKCFLKDFSGSIWVGSSGGGMSRLDSRRFTHFPKEKEVLGELVFSIVKDKKGTIWLASSEGGVTLFDGKSLKRIGQKEGCTSSKVKCLHTLPNGDIWLGTTGDGAYYYNGKAFVHYTTQHGLSSLYINTIDHDKKGRTWFATAGGGVCYFDSATHKFTSLKQRELGANRINTVFVDKDDNIWLGTLQAGLIKIQAFAQGRPFSLQRFTHFSGGTNTDNIRCLAQDGRGRLLIGTAGKGIWCYDGTAFKSLVDKNVIPSANIYFLCQDQKNQTWAGTDKGVTRFELDKEDRPLHVRHFAQSTGLVGTETTHNGVYEEDTGELWFGTIAGAIQYHPKEEMRSVHAPHLQLTDIHLFFDPIASTPYASSLSSWYPIPTSLQLPHDKNSLSFEFIGIDLKSPESVQYRWQLEGFDTQWSPPSNRREAVYSNLPPGQYTFVVNAQNDEGNWSPQPLSYSFEIRPPFWGTWWFRTLLFFLAVGLLFSLYLLRIRNIQKRNAEVKLQLENEKNLLELEQKALHLQMNPHFLFNCLNSIKGLISEDKSEEAKLYLNRFAKLMRAILDSSRTSHHSLAQEIELLQHYVQLEKLSRDNTFELQIKLANNVEPEALLIPSMLLQPFVENAILHGLTTKKENGLIELSFEKQEVFLHCVITDNGIGRKAASEKKQYALDKHDSIALQVIEERLTILTHQPHPLQITDLQTDDGLALGTRIALLLPYQEI